MTNHFSITPPRHLPLLPTAPRVAFAVSVALVAASLGCQHAPPAGSEASAPTPSSTSAAQVSSTQAPAASQDQQGLTYLREEEKLARDVYLALASKWDHRVFHNISRAEQRHMDRVGDLLAARGIPDPIKDSTPGVFTNPQIKKLYQDLVTAGSRSLQDAFVVGAEIEDLDIADLQQRLGHSSDPDIQQVEAALECGSRNHMRAFVRQLEALGASYTPKHVSQSEFQRIIDGEHERCGWGGNGRGRGRGRGWGIGGRQGPGVGRGQGLGAW